MTFSCTKTCRLKSQEDTNLFHPRTSFFPNLALCLTVGVILHDARMELISDQPETNANERFIALNSKAEFQIQSSGQRPPAINNSCNTRLLLY